MRQGMMLTTLRPKCVVVTDAMPFETPLDNIRLSKNVVSN